MLRVMDRSLLGCSTMHTLDGIGERVRERIAAM
jgi:hypothetical protein